MAILRPSEMTFSDKNIIMIISGLPGVGKTTVALSAPDVLLIDTDEGMSRVRPEHRKDAAMCSSYEELKKDIESAKGHYKTIVVDTCGSLIDLMKDWAVKQTGGAKRDGGISVQGYGIIKREFVEFSRQLRKDFNVVYIFHESKSKDGDDTFYDIVCEGSTKTIVWQPADLGAHMQIINGKRYLGFTPTANYNAKSAYGISGLVEVPDLKDGDANTFLSDLFVKVKKNLAHEAEMLGPQKSEYEKIMADGLEMIAAIETPEMAMGVIEAIKAVKHALTSEKELKNALANKCKELGFVWDKKSKAYVAGS